MLIKNRENPRKEKYYLWLTGVNIQSQVNVQIPVYLSALRYLPRFKRLLPAAIVLCVIVIVVSCTKTDVKIIPGKYDPTPYNVGATGSTGITGSTEPTDSTGVIPALFSSPSDVAVDAAGNLYVADYWYNRIQKISTNGTVSTLAGTGNVGAINGIGKLASFNRPSGLTVDAAGNVYVADAGNNLIRKITPDGTVSTLAGTVVAVDTSNTVTSTPLFAGPSGVAVDASGNVYVADAGNNRICVVSPSGNTTTLSGNGNAGSNNGAGKDATFNNPTGVAVDAAGNVYVADMLNNLIRKVAPDGTTSTLAGNGDIGSKDGLDTAARFYFPNSLTVDPSGNVYVTDDINNLVRAITPAGAVTTIAGSGQAGAQNGQDTQASFNDPAGIAVDASDNLYVADANNNLIRKITPAGMVTTVAGVLPKYSLGHIVQKIYYHTGRALNNRSILFNRLH
ncbi:MAG: SMP-30/gluconolactonase/LRE family protein [Bacteroidetes bacterium]|jgi:sugar lactone lactonase YvrE|nr:SMP-30/gluconolactonase/LRE family protein [Bacteroidota bacterium]